MQFKHKLQPLIFDFCNSELVVVDANFIVFLKTHSREELLEYLGIDIGPTQQLDEEDGNKYFPSRQDEVLASDFER